MNGGQSGIRTHGRVSPTHAFQACSLNHSDICPEIVERNGRLPWLLSRLSQEKILLISETTLLINFTGFQPARGAINFIDAALRTAVLFQSLLVREDHSKMVVVYGLSDST